MSKSAGWSSPATCLDKDTDHVSAHGVPAPYSTVCRGAGSTPGLRLKAVIKGSLSSLNGPLRSVCSEMKTEQILTRLTTDLTTATLAKTGSYQTTREGGEEGMW